MTAEIHGRGERWAVFKTYDIMFADLYKRARAWRPRAVRVVRRRGGPYGGVWLALSLALAGPALGQLSPGPLSRAHSQLEGAKNCLKCHGGAGPRAMEEKCLGCHQGIARLVEAARGLHGRGDRGECAECHAEHAGENHDLIDRGDLAAATFDHGQTGWPLRGRHQGKGCVACHVARLQKAEYLKLEPAGRVATGWIGLEADCASCHEDPHQARLGANCAGCHTEEDFHRIPSSAFSHSQTRYPLQGAHLDAACAKCHGEGEGRVARPIFAACSSCHRDPHAGEETPARRNADCDACHGMTAFTPSTFTVERHALADYPLEGAHRRVACRECHLPRGDDSPGGVDRASRVVLWPKHDRCGRCHADAHGGQFSGRPDQGGCEGCHQVAGWKPARISAADHASYALPLEGRHAEAGCRECHGLVRPGLPALPDSSAAGSAGLVFRLGGGDCRGCHVDPHGDRYAAPAAATGGGRTCLECHDARRFVPADVDPARHARYRYALEGAHQAVRCDACHAELVRPARGSSLILTPWEGPQLRFERAHQNCTDCHADPHAGQLQGACSRCHDLESFRPASRFDHARDAAFSLEGGHAKVACAGCHPPEAAPDGRSITRYRPRPTGCEGCHVRRAADAPTRSKSHESDIPSETTR